MQRAYGFLGLRPGQFPVAERCACELLSLPIYPGLKPEQIEFVVETLKACLPTKKAFDQPAAFSNMQLS
jgi:dTDP-4-amino-4,6-dideoxygalactose transaminase